MGWYLVLLAGITTLFIVLLLFHVLAEKYSFQPDLSGFFKIVADDTFVPFYAAGLWACVYLLRVTQEKLTNREFNPAWIPSHLIRLGLGTVAGGTVVFFPELLNTLQGGADVESVKELAGAIQGAVQNVLNQEVVKKTIEAGVAGTDAQKIVQDAVQQTLQKTLESANEKGLGSGLADFIFGYAVDIYYSILDRIAGKISG